MNSEKRELICTCCPLGCSLEAFIEKGEVASITGNSCRRGIDYGIKECTNPTRILTTTMVIENGELGVVSVKSDRDIPREELLSCIKEIKNAKTKAPVQIGDVLVYNILNTGVNIVATMNVESICFEQTA